MYESSSHHVFRVLALIAILSGHAAAQPATAQREAPGGPSQQSTLDRALSRLGDHRYELTYKFRPGETIAYEVEHLVSVKTTIEGNSQNQQSRSKSEKVWRVTKVNPNGNATFSHTIEYVNMWFESQGREPVRYDSRTDQDPPPDYAGIAETLGKPLSNVTVDAFGNVVDRKDVIQQTDLGTGGLLVPLPKHPVTLGDVWAVTVDVPVRVDDGSFKAIKTRQQYRLVSVETGVATLSMETQILTPSISPRVRSQLIQKLSNGKIKFDIEAGRIISRQLEWDESVVGFNGPASNMAYLGRITESLQPSTRTATADSATNSVSAK